MRWATRELVHFDRVAAAWLIRRFVDPDAEFEFLQQDQVAPEGVTLFGVQGAALGAHTSDGSAFEQVLRHLGIADAALDRMAAIISDGVRYVMDSAASATCPETAGLLAVAEGLMLLSAEDAGCVERSLPVYDALYARLQAEDALSIENPGKTRLATAMSLSEGVRRLREQGAAFTPERFRTSLKASPAAPLAHRARAEGPDWIEAGEWASLDELRGLQLWRLKRSLKRAYQSTPPYRELFEAANVHPDHLNQLEDLARFPFTTKDHLRQAYPFGLLASPLSDVVRVHASSGTTGKPTLVGYARRDIALWSELVARSLRAAGVRPGMRVHVAYGYGLFTGGLGAHYGAEKLGCMVIPASGGQSQRQVALIQDLKPDAIMVTPSYMMALLDEFRRQDVDPCSTSLKVGIFGAEPWSEGMRREIESSFSIDAVDIYGLSEIIGPGVANEFVETKDGPTLWEDHFYPEIIDPETGRVLPDGEFGELVLTSLTKLAMPVIRYRTRDLTRLLPGSVRPQFRRLERIGGRSDDMLIIRGVNVFPSQIEAQLLRRPVLSAHYWLEVTREGRLDQLIVHAERRDDIGEERLRAEALNLVQAIKDNVGVSAAVHIHAPGEIARSEGKARRVVDRRKS